MYFAMPMTFNSLLASGRVICHGIAYVNSLDPDQDQQNVGLNLRSTLFDKMILFLQNENESFMYYISFEITIYHTKITQLASCSNIDTEVSNIGPAQSYCCMFRDSYEIANHCI